MPGKIVYGPLPGLLSGSGSTIDAQRGACHGRHSPYGRSNSRPHSHLPCFLPDKRFPRLIDWLCSAASRPRDGSIYQAAPSIRQH
jgi:hypothetical protein